MPETRSKLAPPKTPMCVKSGCKDVSLNFFSCSNCKQSYHVNCFDLDSELISLLEKNSCDNLTWYARCGTCVEKGVPDPLALRSSLIEISESISNKVEEFKNLFSMSSLLEIGSSIQSKLDEFKSCAEKADLISKPTLAPVVANSVQVQTDSYTSVAVQTISPSTTPGFDRTQYSGGNDQKYIRPPSTEICPHYKQSKCRHGPSGKYLVDGRTCSYSHPRKCLRYCRYGQDSVDGCVGPCNYYHPDLCNNSVRYRECLLLNCTQTHLVGTRRHNSSFRDNHADIPHRDQPKFNAPRNSYSFRKFNNDRIQDNHHKRTSDQHQVIQRSNRDTREFHVTRNEFPPLPNKDDTKLDRISSELRELRSYIMQNPSSNRSQIINDITPRLPTHDTSSTKSVVNPLLPQVHQAQPECSKNCQHQSQLFQAR